MYANRRLRIRYSLRTDSSRVLKDSTLFGNKCSLVALFLFSQRMEEFATRKISAQETTHKVVFVNLMTRNTIVYGYAFVG